MRITILGTGSSQGIPIVGCDCPVCTSTDPKDKRLRPSAIIEKNDTVILIDASPDLRTQLVNFYNKRHIDAVLLTHEHRDHVAGLDDLRPIIFTQQKPMDIYALSRTLDALKCLFFYSFQEDLYPGAPQFDLHPIDLQPFDVGDFHIIPIKVMHYKMEILGFRIDNFAYITDAKYILPEEMNKLRGLDVLVINALRKKLHYSHFNLDEALQTIRKLRPQKAYLTHMGHYLGRHQDLLKLLPHNVEPAYDGLVIEI